MEMKNLFEEEKWKNYHLSFFDSLNLYLAEKEIDYNKDYDKQREIGLVNANGQWIYKCAKNEMFLIKHHCYCSKAEESLNKSLIFWATYKNLGVINKVIDKISIFKYENGHAVELLSELNIQEAEIVGPNKVVIGVLQDLESNAEPKKINIKILDTKTNELVDVIETAYYEDEMLGNQLDAHEVHGDNFLFSATIYQLDKRENELYTYLFDNNGKKLFDFDVTSGNNNEVTWFEPTKTGFGITYRRLPSKIKIYANTEFATEIDKSECLIDVKGNYYGEFLIIQGSIPSNAGKSYSKYPKFVDGKILCLTLPDRDGISYLVLFDKQGNRIDTAYQCPWVHTTLFKQYAFISDKKYFGKKCLVVIDNDNMAQLIDFDGDLIENVIPTSYEGVGIYGKFAKYFMDQVI